MRLSFTKYHATGNDFILIDNRSGEIRLSAKHIEQLCHRRFGIGADGLILIEPHGEADFYVNYYNADGSQSLCGNGSRAAVHFANQLGIRKNPVLFAAYDGFHEASVLADGQIRIQLHPVSQFDKYEDGIFINTGSPHFIRWVTDIGKYPVVQEGRNIRFSERFKSCGGTNVNFAEQLPGNALNVRTYERGVEDETLSCGTGVTACALAAALQHGYTSPVLISTQGGTLKVEFDFNAPDRSFRNVYLTGPAAQVFTGQTELH